MPLTREARRAREQPVLGTSDVADLFGISRQLAAKWAKTWRDWPAPYAELRQGTVWRTEDVLACAARHERKPGEGPRPGGDPRPPSVARSRRRPAPRARAS